MNSFLPPPRGYAWYLNDGSVEYTSDEMCPVRPEEWGYAAALFDADQLREDRAAVAALVVAARQVLLLGTDRTDAAGRALANALEKFE